MNGKNTYRCDPPLIDTINFACAPLSAISIRFEFIFSTKKTEMSITVRRLWLYCNRNAQRTWFFSESKLYYTKKELFIAQLTLFCCTHPQPTHWNWYWKYSFFFFVSFSLFSRCPRAIRKGKVKRHRNAEQNERREKVMRHETRRKINAFFA